MIILGDTMSTASFLSAIWKHLVMINYEIDPDVLTPFTPKGTHVDFWNSKAYVSLVGFLFLDTLVRGISIPFHTDFEEVNLRFYVKRDASPTSEERRGVVFIKEFVPRWGIAYLARLLYNENYVSLPMRHCIVQHSSQITAQYEWKFKGRWQHIHVLSHGDPQLPLQGSEAQFITEHFWGYSKQRNGETLEYQVQHPSWRVWKVDQYEVDMDTKNLYGAPFSPFLEKTPTSVFLTEGSEVTVFKGKKLPTT